MIAAMTRPYTGGPVSCAGLASGPLGSDEGAGARRGSLFCRGNRNFLATFVLGLFPTEIVAGSSSENGMLYLGFMQMYGTSL